MSSSREESPDWLRAFQAPSQTLDALSSESEPPLNDDQLSDDEDEIKLSKLFKKDTPISSDRDWEESPDRTVSKAKSSNKNNTPGRKRKRNDTSENEEIKDDKIITKRKVLAKPKTEKPDDSVWTLSSDSDVEVEEDKVSVKKSPKKQLKKDDIKKEKDVIDVKEETKTEKQNAPQVSTTRLPLVLSDKVQRSKALVECEGDSIDLSGDVGAVGRLVISDTPSGNNDMLLDLKGTIYKTSIVPSRTFCVVSFGPSEAKIEAIMNDFIQLTPQSNVYEAETMEEGTLEGFTFDSDEEADPKTKGGQNDKNEGDEEQPKGKAKGKGKTEKTRGAAGKKGKPAGGKPAKKVTKKAPASKKGKAKK